MAERKPLELRRSTASEAPLGPPLVPSGGRERIEHLYRISSSLVRALTLDDVAEITLGVIKDLLGAEVASLTLVNAEARCIELLAFSGTLDPVAMERFRSISLDDYSVPVTVAVRSAAPVFIESPEEHERRFPEMVGGSPYQGGTRISVPLLVADGVLGAMNFGFRRWQRLDDEERSFLLAVADQCALALERARLYDAERKARKHAEAAQRETNLLFRLSESIGKANALDEVYEPALECVLAALHVERAAILLLDDAGKMRFRSFKGLSEDYRQSVEGHSPWSPEERHPLPWMIEDVRLEDSLAALRPVLAAEGIVAAGFIPLVHQQRLLGKFMVYCEGPRRFAQREVELAQTIAAEVSQAIARAELLESERLARSAAEGHAQRMHGLQQLTARLSQAATPGQVAEAVIDEGIRALHAAAGGLWLVNESDRRVELLYSSNFSPERSRDFLHIAMPSAIPMPVLDVLHERKPIWLADKASFSQHYPELAAKLEPRLEYGVACLPLIIDERCVGALSYTFEHLDWLDEAQRDLLLTMAHHSELALARAQLFEREQRARARAELEHRRAAFKAEAGNLLASSLDYETTLKNVARLSIPNFADWCAVELLEEHGHIKVVAVEHADPAKVEFAWRLRERYPHSAQAERGVPQVLRSGRAELYEEIDDTLLLEGALNAEHLSLLQTLHLKSAIIAPMTVHGRTIGAITFIFAESGRRYDREDLEVAVALAQRAALAVENSRLHSELRRALRTRDDLLAVVSHDLRNPLHTVKMRVASIARHLPPAPEGETTRRGIERIEASIQRMEQLIADLLDLGSIEAGRLKVVPKEEKVNALLAQAFDESHSLAAEKALHLRLMPPAEDLRVHCDRERILQVFSNLMGNAIKFTPAGGSVILRAFHEDRWVRFVVENSGSFIQPAHLERIFDRYYQESENEVRGVGLGLFIARGIVASHGGCIWAESSTASGPSFSFPLSLA